MSSEREDQPLASSSGHWIVIGIVGVVLFSGCLLACAGLAGIGFIVPQRQARQSQRAEAAAQHAAAHARDRSRAVQQKPAEAVNPPTAARESGQTAVDGAPAAEDPSDDRRE